MDSKKPGIETVWHFSQVVQAFGIVTGLPDLNQLYLDSSSAIESMADEEMVEDPNDLKQWRQTFTLLQIHQPEWFSSVPNSRHFAQMLEHLSNAVEADLGWDDPENDLDELTEQLEHFQAIATELQEIQVQLRGHAHPNFNGKLNQRCEARVDRLEEKISEIEEDEPEEAPQASRPRDSETFNVEQFFSDL